MPYGGLIIGDLWPGLQLAVRPGQCLTGKGLGVGVRVTVCTAGCASRGDRAVVWHCGYW